MTMWQEGNFYRFSIWFLSFFDKKNHDFFLGVGCSFSAKYEFASSTAANFWGAQLANVEKKLVSLQPERGRRGRAKRGRAHQMNV